MTLQVPAVHEEASLRDHRHAADELGVSLLTVMSYRSMADQPAEADLPAAAGLSGRMRLNVPRPEDFAARCLAVGIGTGGSGVVNELAAASWFAHLRGTATGPRCSIQHAGQRGDGLLRLLGAFPAPHVVSVALPAMPTSDEVNLTGELGRLMRREYGAFVVVTSALADTEMLAHLGQACDCFVGGDGGLVHHHYPIRTVSEPASGRLVCYDLYDACSMWAGSVGEYGVFRAAADALHVEVSATMTLSEVDNLAAGYGARLSSPVNLKLFNVVGDANLPEATPVSFWRNSLVCQDRAPEPAAPRVTQPTPRYGLRGC